jgi:hypothetical protein
MMRMGLGLKLHGDAFCNVFLGGLRINQSLAQKPYTGAMTKVIRKAPYPYLVY